MTAADHRDELARLAVRSEACASPRGCALPCACALPRACALPCACALLCACALPCARDLPRECAMPCARPARRIDIEAFVLRSPLLMAALSSTIRAACAARAAT